MKLFAANVASATLRKHRKRNESVFFENFARTNWSFWYFAGGIYYVTESVISYPLSTYAVIKELELSLVLQRHLVTIDLSFPRARHL